MGYQLIIIFRLKYNFICSYNFLYIYICIKINFSLFFCKLLFY